MSRDQRMFMTGAIVSAVAGNLFALWDEPWWLALPLSLFGVWIIFDVIRAWVREWRISRQRAGSWYGEDEP